MEEVDPSGNLRESSATMSIFAFLFFVLRIKRAGASLSGTVFELI